MSKASSVKLEESWLKRLEQEFESDYFTKLKFFLRAEKAEGKTIFPPGPEIFSALDHTPFDQTKVVIIGQDPYHGFGQAHGLCFSVREGVPIPPSLINIYKELNQDLGVLEPTSGDLTPWAKQGVLLLNATLTVEANKAGSHQNKGWEIFTDKIISLLNQEREHIVFMLWGGYAKRKGKHIDRKKHLVLESGHPSPLSANRGYWFGNRHFSRANMYLKQHHQNPINWELSTP